MEILHSTEMLSIVDYAERQGINARTVKRWLAADELPGAEKDPFTGAWRIPANATRMVTAKVDPQPGPGTELEFGPAYPGTVGQFHGWPPAAVAPEEPTRLEDLEELPAFLTIAQAAEYLGIPQAQILAHRETFGVMDVGVNGSPRVPKAIVHKFESGPR